nr:putative ribonuclease H-like domain-containing protein [Tanacetum cinerariifolium]
MHHGKGNVQEQEMVFNQEDTPSELNEHVQEQKKSSTQEETSERYVLPPRANQGVPPKRYFPEKVSRGSRYPMANIAKGNLSKEAKAFVASVYSDEIHANTEQALKYILDLLAETGMIDCKPADTPMIVNQKLYMEEKAELADKGRYQRMVGKLIYLSHTRPDIAYVVVVVSQFMHQPQKNHMKAVMRILRYLKGTTGHGVLFKPNGHLVTQYAVGVVSQFMHQPQKNHMKAVMRILRYLKGTTGHGVLFKPNGHLVTQYAVGVVSQFMQGNLRSTSGYFTVVGGNLVTWRSKKQKAVSLSSAEAEFRGIARGLTKVLWVRRLLTEIGYPPQEASKIMSDNKAAIQISKNSVQHDRTKHVEVDRHFIKEKLEAEIITLLFVRSEDQLADILTKSVNERALHKCLVKLNFEDPTIQLEVEC